MVQSQDFFFAYTHDQLSTYSSFTSTNPRVKIQLVVNSTWLFLFNNFSFRASSHCGKLIPCSMSFLWSIYMWHSLKQTYTHTQASELPQEKTCLHSLQKILKTGFSLFSPKEQNDIFLKKKHMIIMSRGGKGRLKWIAMSCRCFVELKHSDLFFS